MARRVFFLLMALLGVSLFAQENITQDKAYVGRNFKVYIKTRIPYSRDLNVELTEDFDQLQSAGDPYLRPYNALTDREGEIIYEDMSEIVLTFRAEGGDIYTCRGVRLYRQQFESVIPDFPVVVHNWDEGNLDYPLQVYWSPVKSEAYTGEIVSLILNVRYMENLDFPESIGLGKPALGNLEQVELPGRIDTYDMGDRKVYSYPLESWYFFSGETGELTIPGGEARIRGLNRKIPDQNIRILPLPEEVNRSGGVGDFSLSTRLSGDSAAEGEILTFTVRIEGTGNFSFLSFPSVEGEGMELINTADEEELIPTEAGYSGFRERVYRFQAGSRPTQSISCSSFSWINPETHRIGTYRGETFPVQVTLKGNLAEQNLSLLTPSELEWLIVKERMSGPAKWFLFLPGLIYFLILLFSLSKDNGARNLPLLLICLPLFLSLTSGTERKIAASEALALYEKGEYGESYRLFRELEDNTGYAAYLPNLAIIEFYRGNPVESEILFREALGRLPGDPAIRKKLFQMEALAGLKDQYYAGINPGSALLFLLFAAGGNLFFLSLAGYLKRRKLRLLFLMATIFFLSLGLGGASALSFYQSRRPQGIIMERGGETGRLRRIPEETAEEWLTLPPGTSLFLIREKRGYYFIRTGYGLEGWIDRDLVKPVEIGGSRES